jgi:hypothetical protein
VHPHHWSQVVDAAGRALSARILRFILAAKERISPRALAALLDENEAAVMAALGRLNSLFPRRPSADGDDHIFVFHKSVADWLTDGRLRDNPYFVDMSVADNELSSACARLLENLDDLVLDKRAASKVTHSKQ